VKSLGQNELKSTRIPNATAYDKVALEYYDEIRHPTCADLREASRLFFARLFEKEDPSGRLADIGCGRSLVAEFKKSELVLVDSSTQMLDQNNFEIKRRVIDVEFESFGESEFDWIFAVLADPYNSISSWNNIFKALKVSGTCVFIVPSFVWSQKFRLRDSGEREGFARFIIAGGEDVFLRSVIVSSQEQEQLIIRAGLQLHRCEHVYTKDMTMIKSAKISGVLSPDEPILDIYIANKN
jgi:trans-aconitate methyltransferase